METGYWWEVGTVWDKIDCVPLGVCVLGKVVLEYNYHCLIPIVIVDSRVSRVAFVNTR